MNTAFSAMQFAMEVHKDQKRIGDMRTADPRLVQAMVNLYESGLAVAWIARTTGIGATAIRNYVANHDIERNESLFRDGAQCMASEGEELRRISWAPWYFVSSRGRILGMSPDRPGSFLKAEPGNSGYLTVKLAGQDGIRRHNPIHRTVLRVFVGESPAGHVAAHGDGNKRNNRLDNLRWATYSENALDKWQHGTMLCGSANPLAKIDEGKAAQVKAAISANKPRRVIASELDVSLACIGNIANGSTWRHV